MALPAAIRRMLDTVDYHPTVVSSAMGCAMHVVDSRDEMSARGEKGLSIGKDGRVGRSGDGSVKVVVHDNFDEACAAIRHGRAERQNFVVAVAVPVLVAGGTEGDAANHDVIDVMMNTLVEQTGQFLVDLRRTGRGNRDVALGHGRKSGANEQYDDGKR